MIKAVELGGRAAAEHACGTAAVGNQGCRLAVALFEVGLKGLGRVEAVEALLHLPIREIHDHAAEQLDHIEVIEVGKVPAGLSEEEVAGKNGNAGIEPAVDRVHPAPGGSLIHHIVVNERGRVDHFSDLSQAAVAGRELSLRGQGPRQKQNDAGAQPLAAGTEQMLGSGLEDGVTCPDQAAQVSEQGFKICLYRLE